MTAPPVASGGWACSYVVTSDKTDRVHDVPIKTTAAIALKPGEPFVVADVGLNPPGDGEVLVETRAAGLCHTDLGVLDGYSPIPVQFPVVLGHEGAGIVLETGPGVHGLKPGDHVVSFMPECHHCAGCHHPTGNFCEAAFDYSAVKPTMSSGEAVITAGYSIGTFARHFVTEQFRLVSVRKDAPFDEISYLSCGATTGIGAVLTTAKVHPGASVIIFGLGGIGLNIVQGARMAGATTIIGVDTNPAKTAIARQLGATAFVNPTDAGEGLVALLNEMTRGGGDYTFEAAGHIATIKMALATARMGWGVCTVVGVAPAGQTIDVLPFDLIMGRKLQGCTLGGVRGSQLSELVDLLMQGRFDLKSLITDRLPLEKINEGYDKMRRGEGLRSVLMF